MQDENLNKESLGLELKPGDRHYRAFVGPPQDYDLIAAMSFNLVTTLGLRQHHRVLDIGCGSLRVGRLLIPYLNRGNYFGLEPNGWLVEAGVSHEIGQDMIRIKQPVFIIDDSLAQLESDLQFDFAIAESIFSHCGLDLIDKWMREISQNLKRTGALVCTFVEDSQDYQGTGWVYPGVVGYKFDTISRIAARYHIMLTKLNWFHPRQTWVICCGPEFPAELFASGEVHWNNLTKAGRTL